MIFKYVLAIRSNNHDNKGSKQDAEELITRKAVEEFNTAFNRRMM